MIKQVDLLYICTVVHARFPPWCTHHVIRFISLPAYTGLHSEYETNTRAQ